MKKIRINETELVSLIEKLVKENFAQGAANGNGQNFGIMGTPTAKYKEIFEKEDIEEDEENIDTAQDADQTLNLNVMKKTNQTDLMEGIEESKLISRIKRRLSEGKCPKSGCITKRGKKWRIISNKTGKLWDAEYDSKADAEAGLDAYHANN